MLRFCFEHGFLVLSPTSRLQAATSRLGVAIAASHRTRFGAPWHDPGDPPMPGTDSHPPSTTSPVRPARRALRVTLATSVALTLTVVLSAIGGASGDPGTAEVQDARS